MISTQAQCLLADLGSVLKDDLARFARGIAVVPCVHELRFEALFTPSLIEDHVERYNKEYGESDRRAIFSIWALRHFQAVLPTLLSANIFLDCSPILELDRLAFLMSTDLTVRELRIGPDLVDLRGMFGTARFRGLVETYLAPLIERIAARTAVTKRVLWSNAGTTVDGFLRIIEPVAEGNAHYQDAKALLQSPLWPDGTANRLFSPVHYVDQRRIRRICCMRYLVPDDRLCAICPLDASHRARRRKDDQP